MLSMRVERPGVQEREMLECHRYKVSHKAGEPVKVTLLAADGTVTGHFDLKPLEKVFVMNESGNTVDRIWGPVPR